MVVLAGSTGPYEQNIAIYNIPNQKVPVYNEMVDYFGWSLNFAFRSKTPGCVLQHYGLHEEEQQYVPFERNNVK
jgi:hypothetical protein